MALGAAQVPGRFSHDGRPSFMDILSFAGDGAYTAGGTANFRAYAQQAVARGHIDILAVVCLTPGFRTYYNRQTDRLSVFNEAGTEMSGNQSGTTLEVLVISC